ncbi:unnamed protein product [Mytilus coruscus]|uniref:Uncharacterized protein n=1 Tax=Mytilus coruscus TaxID=42192 RepID=A0A6J8AJI2_MYTCO|nr:unnamed protein product [Mytilus coruscus]
MKQLNIQKNYRFKELVDESLIVDTDNTHLDSKGNFIIEIEQENDGLKMYSHETKNWDQIYLDKVLNDGNKIYSRFHGDNVHLLVSDLPGMIEMSGKILKISRKESITAVIDNYGTIDFSKFGNSLPLDQALQESLIDYDACFICAYDTTYLALKHNQDVLLFDSHARNKFGLQDSDGKSLLLKLNNLDHLYQYCCNMIAGSSQNQWFEVTGVSICIENCTESFRKL